MSASTAAFDSDSSQSEMCSASDGATVVRPTEGFYDTALNEANDV
ncbi:hypothetical protein RE6C_01048 [Rhodopirellula europaea 6C]|uniref:Uncharacterized protein n=1 Tax=Rhodopirellula europaea 6C TaxID=1263867 RepID=M2B7R2_9BACT|nr:hypothetical protein RE6C_01048 [Rhodopirellula europaea 6C]